MTVPFSIRRMIAGTFVLNVAVIRAIFEVRYKCLAQTLNDRARDLRHICRSLQINSEGVARHGFLQCVPQILAADTWTQALGLEIYIGAKREVQELPILRGKKKSHRLLSQSRTRACQVQVTLWSTGFSTNGYLDLKSMLLQALEQFVPSIKRSTRYLSRRAG